MWRTFSLLSHRKQRIAQINTYSKLELEYKVHQLLLLLILYVQALLFIFGQLSVYSTHQSHCNWSAVSWIHLLLFHYKQDQAAAGAHLGQWEMRSVKPGLRMADRDRWPYFDDTVAGWTGTELHQSGKMNAAYSQGSGAYSYGHKLPYR